MGMLGRFLCSGGGVTKLAAVAALGSSVVYDQFLAVAGAREVADGGGEVGRHFNGDRDDDGGGGLGAFGHVVDEVVGGGD